MNNDWTSSYAFNLFAAELQWRTGRRLGHQLSHTMAFERLVCIDCGLPAQALVNAATRRKPPLCPSRRLSKNNPKRNPLSKALEGFFPTERTERMTDTMHQHRTLPRGFKDEMEAVAEMWNKDNLIYKVPERWEPVEGGVDDAYPWTLREVEAAQ